MPDNNRREYYRVMLHVPLSAQFKIIGYRNEKLDSSSSYMYIVDISAGGVRMHSKLNMPENDGLLLEFHFQLMNQELRLLGALVRKRKLEGDIFEYGIEFILDDPTRDKLLSHLHTLSIRLKNTQVLTSCSFCTEEEMKRFYET